MNEIGTVITCYNLGRTLEEALNSVLAQTRAPAEVVVVDDGSTDIFTQQLIMRIDRTKTRVVRTANRGVSAARNFGIKLTRAPYLVLLDADDWFDPTYFEKAAARLDGDEGLDFISCAQRGFGALEYVWKPPAVNLVDHVTRGPFHISTMFRRKVWEAVGGFQEGLPADEEMDFWTSVLAHGFRGEVLEEPLLNYRVRSDSMYHRLLQREMYVPLRKRFYEKHLQSLEPHFQELLLAKESMILEQRAHAAHLETTKIALDQEEASLRAVANDLCQSLANQGVPSLDWGDLGRLEPISPYWGVERGQPINRYYVTKFLQQHREDICGRVLEVKDSFYTRSFGGDRVTRSDVLDIDPLNPVATVVADLARADKIPSNWFDCFIFTQTLNFIYDIRAALSHAFRILRPGGVLLATVSALDRISYETGPDGDYWRFTEGSLRALLAEQLPVDAFEITGFGNVATCAAYLYGLASHEIDSKTLDALDPWFPMGFCVRAVKPIGSGSLNERGAAVRNARKGERNAAAILAYHRIAILQPDTHQLCVTPINFRQHMECLRDNYRPMPLQEIVRAAIAGAIPERAVAVTFDDGYLDALETVEPILSEFEVPATFFVNTEGLEEAHEFWWDTLERIFLLDHPLPPTLELNLNGKALSLSTDTDTERARTHEIIREAVYKMGLSERNDIVSRLKEWSRLQLDPRGEYRSMTGNEIRRLSECAYCDIGAHTTRHLVLPAQPIEIQRWEIADNKRALEDLLGQSVSLFAYPHGEYCYDTTELVRSSSFLAAVTIDEGLVLPGINPFLLPRFEIKNCDRNGFKRRLDVMFGCQVT